MVEIAGDSIPGEWALEDSLIDLVSICGQLLDKERILVLY